MTTELQPDASSSPPRRGALPSAAWALAALYVFLGAFPGWRVPGGTFLDGEWVLEVNRLSVGAFGGDLAFTYGPLGFLLYPAGTALHVVLALALRGVVLAALAWWVLRRGEAIDRLLFALAQVAAVGLGLTFEYQLLIPTILLAARAPEEPRGARATALALAALAGGALFMKFSTGVALAAVVGAAWLARLLRERGKAIPEVALAGAAALSAVLLIAATMLESPAGLLPWLRRCVELAGGYAEVMGTDSAAPGRTATLAAAVGVLGVALGLGAWGVWRSSPAGRVALLAAGPLFLAFKHAFVRQDVWHTTLYFPLALAVAAAAALLARSRTERIWCRAGVGVAAALSIWVAWAYAPPQAEALAASARTLSGFDGARNLLGWLRVDQRRDELQRLLAPYSPPALPAILAGRPLGVVPFRLGVCALPGVSCTPNPTLQTFATYTSSLDEWSGEHYLGPQAPPFVLLHPDGIDERAPALDHPALWRALVAAYRVADRQPGGGLLLERKATFDRPRLVEVARTSAAAEQWVPVPDVAGPLYASIALDPTWLGRLRRAAYRVEPVALVLEYPGGLRASFRLAPDTARDGLPIDELPLFPEELPVPFRGGLLRRPMRIGLSGDGLGAYRQPFTVTWLKLTDGPTRLDPPGAPQRR